MWHFYYILWVKAVKMSHQVKEKGVTSFLLVMGDTLFLLVMEYTPFLLVTGDTSFCPMAEVSGFRDKYFNCYRFLLLLLFTYKHFLFLVFMI